MKIVVGVAQYQTVTLGVAGSIPVTHPIFLNDLVYLRKSISLKLQDPLPLDSPAQNTYVLTYIDVRTNNSIYWYHVENSRIKA